jgi:hypothetical protein
MCTREEVEKIQSVLAKHIPQVVRNVELQSIVNQIRELGNGFHTLKYEGISFTFIKEGGCLTSFEESVTYWDRFKPGKLFTDQKTTTVTFPTGGVVNTKTNNKFVFGGLVDRQNEFYHKKLKINDLVKFPIEPLKPMVIIDEFVNFKVWDVVKDKDVLKHVEDFSQILNNPKTKQKP